MFCYRNRFTHRCLGFYRNLHTYNKSRTYTFPVPVSEEQRRATRRQIQKAIDMKDPEMLERYIQAYEKLNPAYDDEMLVKARKVLAALDAKEGEWRSCAHARWKIV